MICLRQPRGSLARRAQAELTGDSPAKTEKRVPPHFLGAVVLDQLPSKAGEVDQRAVIDGQQRLTTIQLLLRALADVLSEQESARAGQIKRLLFNPLDNPDPADEVRYKLWPRRKDRDVWRLAMSDSLEDNPGNHLYGQARTYFAKRARSAISIEVSAAELADQAGGELDLDVAVTSDAVDLDTLVDAAIGLFKLVAIDLDDNDNAQIIFEVLNGRQTPLSAADLVKNLLFLHAEISDEAELEQLHEKYWAPLEADWSASRSVAAMRLGNVVNCFSPPGCLRRCSTRPTWGDSTGRSVDTSTTRAERFTTSWLRSVNMPPPIVASPNPIRRSSAPAARTRIGASTDSGSLQRSHCCSGWRHDPHNSFLPRTEIERPSPSNHGSSDVS